MIRKQIAEKITYIVPPIVERNRSIRIWLIGEEGTTFLIYVHLDPKLNDGPRRKVLRQMGDVNIVPTSGWLTGDINTPLWENFRINLKKPCIHS